MTALADHSQRTRALARANEARIDGAELKREMRAGLPLSSALFDPRAGAVEVGDLLLAQPHWGPVKSRGALKRLGISEHRRVRELTPREAGAVAGLGGR